jgi:hypothetical protein
MPVTPNPSPYRPETAILELGGAFYDPVEPADFPQTLIRATAGTGCSISGPRDRARLPTAGSATAD